MVGRIRESAGGAGLILWLAVDTQRLTALNAVRLAELRQELLPGDPGPEPAPGIH